MVFLIFSCAWGSSTSDSSSESGDSGDSSTGEILEEVPSRTVLPPPPPLPNCGICFEALQPEDQNEM